MLETLIREERGHLQNLTRRLENLAFRYQSVKHVYHLQESHYGFTMSLKFVSKGEVFLSYPPFTLRSRSMSFSSIDGKSDRDSTWSEQQIRF